MADIEWIDDIKEALPTDGHVLVKTDIIEEKTAGGLYLPETAKDRQQFAEQKGQIIHVGPWVETEFCVEVDGKWISGCKLQKGNVEKHNIRCQFARYAGQKVRVKDQPADLYQVINDKDITQIFIQEAG